MILLSTALAANLILDLSLDEDDGGLTPEVGDLQWEFGEPSTGPQSAFTGTNVWATRLDAPYLNDADGRLLLPSEDLTSLTSPQLAFWHWSDIHGSDVARIEVLDGSTWTLIEPVYDYPTGDGFTGSSDGWQFVVVDLQGVSNLDQVRLRLIADESVQDAGWYIDAIQVWDGDVAEPQLDDLDLLDDTDDLDGPYLVSVAAEDDVALVQVQLVVSLDGGSDSLVEMSMDGDRWVGEVPGQAPDTQVSYAVVATDGANSARLPLVGYEGFRVRLPAPTGLVGPEGRVVDVVAGLDWTPPESDHTVLEYRIWRDEDVVEVVDTPPAEVELLGDDRFSVSAVFDAGEGDRSKTLVLNSSRPRVTAVEPPEFWQGESVRLEVEGSYLLLVQGDVEASLGPGVTVTAIEVLDVDRCEVLVEVAETAEVGQRELVLTTGNLEVIADVQVLLSDGSDRPALLDVLPAELTQGESGTLRIRASQPLNELPLVDLGDEVVVERVRMSGDDTVLVDVVVGPSAPVGWRPVEVDDGRRLLSGVEFEVVAYAPEVTTCGPGVPSGGLVLLLLAVSRRSGPRAA